MPEEGVCPSEDEMELEELLASEPPDHVYEGRPPHTVLRDGAELPLGPSLRAWSHSPTGFSWGYGGSGPAQLALAILLSETSARVAVQYHQDFKWKFVAGWPMDSPWRITSAEIHDWLLTAVRATA